ncbi:MAG: PHP domain-containing protein [Candidatus Cloacimonadales bacterium]|nr:PHP domain-containing protein [Candidatus Cloacimonadales bacterium]
MKKKNIFGKDYYELTGCIHNHSEYSYDGSISLARIIREAKLRELDYITINDHMTLEARNDSAVQKEKDMLVIVGTEINDTQKNHHFLVFNSDVILKGKEVEEYTEFYANSDAVCFAAHPIEKRICAKFRKFEWEKKEIDNFDGIEIWNYLSEWIGKMKPKFNGLFLVVFPSLFICKPDRATLDWWDELNRSGKRRSAIGSVDAHTERMEKLGIKFKFLRHRTLYKAIRTNVLLDSELEVNEPNILNALKKGNSYIVNNKVGNPYNFYAGISSQENGKAIFGDEIKFTEDMKFYYRLPDMAKVTLYRDGYNISSQRHEMGFFEIEKPGNYRLEITRWGRGWIYTNNIYVIE